MEQVGVCQNFVPKKPKFYDKVSLRRSFGSSETTSTHCISPVPKPSSSIRELKHLSDNGGKSLLKKFKRMIQSEHQTRHQITTNNNSSEINASLHSNEIKLDIRNDLTNPEQLSNSSLPHNTARHIPLANTFNKWSNTSAPISEKRLINNKLNSGDISSFYEPQRNSSSCQRGDSNINDNRGSDTTIGDKLLHTQALTNEKSILKTYYVNIYDTKLLSDSKALNKSEGSSLSCANENAELTLLNVHDKITANEIIWKKSATKHFMNLAEPTASTSHSHNISKEKTEATTMQSSNATDPLVLQTSKKPKLKQCNETNAKPDTPGEGKMVSLHTRNDKIILLSNSHNANNNDSNSNNKSNNIKNNRPSQNNIQLASETFYVSPKVRKEGEKEETRQAERKNSTGTEVCMTAEDPQIRGEESDDSEEDIEDYLEKQETTNRGKKKQNEEKEHNKNEEYTAENEDENSVKEEGRLRPRRSRSFSLMKERRSREFLKQRSRVLGRWFVTHFTHPYPTKAQKDQLAKDTNMSRKKVSEWFGNMRRRIREASRGQNLTWEEEVRRYNDIISGKSEPLPILPGDTIVRNLTDREQDDAKQTVIPVSPKFKRNLLHRYLNDFTDSCSPSSSNLSKREDTKTSSTHPNVHRKIKPSEYKANAKIFLVNPQQNATFDGSNISFTNYKNNYFVENSYSTLCMVPILNEIKINVERTSECVHELLEMEEQMQENVLSKYKQIKTCPSTFSIKRRSSVTKKSSSNSAVKRQKTEVEGGGIHSTKRNLIFKMDHRSSDEMDAAYSLMDLRKTPEQF